MKETGKLDKQSRGKSQAGANTQKLTNSPHNQRLFTEWVAAAKSSDDVRNRIAVVGGTISRGSFGAFYLLAANDSKAAYSDRAVVNIHSVAANDVEFEPSLATESR